MSRLTEPSQPSLDLRRWPRSIRLGGAKSENEPPFGSSESRRPRWESVFGISTKGDRVGEAIDVRRYLHSDRSG